MIAGGFAVAMYGYPRYTGDIDIWVNPTQQNAVYMLQVIQQLGFADHHVTLEDLTTPDIVVQLGYPPNRIDMSTGLTGVDFAACWERKVSQPFGNTTAYFISLNDLRETKKATARQQDLLDLQNLPE
ncbi:hypothetical protein C1N53_00985 [Pontibacter sp. SGAir0037]|nr:hypothetical protein C1N53_00985 [Pontibacter sp. SGAir0037]